MKNYFNKKSPSKGFTLIELLIVIAVLGVLAMLVIVAIDPIQQLARARDSGRKTTVSQLSNAAQAYYTSRQASYPTANNTWITTLVNAGEVKSAPAAVTYSVSGTAACTTNAQNGWCYNLNVGSTEAAVWARLESKTEISKCASGNPYFVWDSSRGTTCLVCTGGDPTIGTACNTTQ